MHMRDQLVLRGRVRRGVGQGQYFTRLEWVCRQIQQQFGFDPAPGTFNIVIEPEQKEGLSQMRKQAEAQIVPPDRGFCLADCVAVRVRAVPIQDAQDQPASTSQEGVVVIPLVQNYPDLLLEIMASVNLRQALGVEDGDAVEVRVRHTS